WRLHRPPVEAATGDERTVLNAWTDVEGAGAEFCVSLGMEKRSIERRSRLLTAEIDRTMIHEWIARAADRAADYALVGFDDRCPDDMLESFVSLTDVMNTAPRDDLDMEDW